MKKAIIITAAVLVIASGIVLVAQREEGGVSSPEQMEECIAMVKRLQSGDERTRQEVMERLKRDDEWTLLDDIGDRSVDEDKRYMTLGLNDMAYEAAISKLENYGNPQGVFVHGTNPEYSICFIEKCLAAGSEVTYVLKEREGVEKIAVVEMAEDDLDVWMNGKKATQNGTVIAGEAKSSRITLRLRNRRGYAVNFVIINQH